MHYRWVLDLRPEDGVELAPSCAPATIAAATATLGPGPVAWAVGQAQAAERIVLDALPDLAGPRSVDTVRRPTEACLLLMLSALETGSAPETLPIPEPVTAANQDLVQRGITLDRLVRSVWTAHSHSYRQLVDFVDRAVPAAEVAGETRRLTDIAFAFLDAFVGAVSAEYTAQRDSWLGSLDATRRQVVQDIIAERRIAVRDPGRVLGTELARHHVGVIVWADGGVIDAALGLHRLAVELTAAAAAAGPVVVPAGGSALWCWMSWPGPPPDGLARRVRAAVTPPAGLRVALGPARPGIAGFRQSHLGALESRRVADQGWGRVGGSWLVDHGEVELLALLTGHAEQARWFISEQLGELAASGDRFAELRETLRLYLAYGRSRSTAAQLLHVATTTVAYRVRQAEGLLPDDIGDDPVRLRLALELCSSDDVHLAT